MDIICAISPIVSLYFTLRSLSSKKNISWNLACRNQPLTSLPSSSFASSTVPTTPLLLSAEGRYQIISRIYLHSSVHLWRYHIPNYSRGRKIANFYHRTFQCKKSTMSNYLESRKWFFDWFLINLGAVHVVRSVFCSLWTTLSPAWKIMQNRAYQSPWRKLENPPSVAVANRLQISSLFKFNLKISNQF